MKAELPVMQVPSDRSYTKDHEWALQVGNTVTLGITDYAQDALGDVVYVQLPEVGASVTKGSSFAEVDSTKSVSDIYSPVSGSVIRVNVALGENPELVNSSPYDLGWIAVVEADEPSDLEVMSAQEYAALIAI